MAGVEVAAGAVAAEQVVSTAVEGGIVAGVAAAKPTLPLKASVRRLLVSSGPQELESLERFQPAIAVRNGKIYIFGGRLQDGSLAGNEMHIIPLSDSSDANLDYKCVPALPAPTQAGRPEILPPARYGAAAVTIGTQIFMFGGHGDGESKAADDIEGRVWCFDTEELHWDYLDPPHGPFPEARQGALAAAHGDKLLIHGGFACTSSESAESMLGGTYLFTPSSKTWTALPHLDTGDSQPMIRSASTAQHNTIYLLTSYTTPSDADTAAAGTGGENAGHIHFLDLPATSASKDGPDPVWGRLPFLAVPNAPSPGITTNLPICSIHTGMGRQYLLLLSPNTTATTASAEPEEKSNTPSNLWALQLPAQPSSLASVKDWVRAKAGMEPQECRWAELDVTEGKVEDMGQKPLLVPVDGTKVLVWAGMPDTNTPEAEPQSAAEQKALAWVVDIHS